VTEKRVFISYVKLSEEDVARLKYYAEVYTPTSQGFDEAKQLAEAVLCISLGVEELGKLKNLRFIQVLSAGVDSLAWKSIPEHVVVCGNMGSNADAVAEHTWALILTLVKRLHHYIPRVREGDFSRSIELGLLNGRTLCIVGMGSIGRRVAEVGKAFGMKVVGVTRSGKTSLAVDRVVKPEVLREILPISDVVVLAAPLTKYTFKMIGLEELRLLKKDCVLVNVGRAELVDRMALLQYLRENPQAYVATDVWWKTPKDEPWENELTKYPNFVGTPWIAGAFGSTEVYNRMVKTALENIERYFRGEPLQNVINREDYV